MFSSYPPISSHHVLSGHEPKDLFKVWKEKCIIAQEQLVDISGGGSSSSPRKNEQKDVPLRLNNVSSTSNGGQGVGQGFGNVGGAPVDRIAVPSSLARKAPSISSKGIPHLPTTLTLLPYSILSSTPSYLNLNTHPTPSSPQTI